VNSPPAAGAALNNQNPLGPVPAEGGQSERRSYQVKVVNAIWNGSGTIRRKKAEHYVLHGRAEWLGSEQVRMLMSHPANRAAAAEAAAAYESIQRTMSREELAHLPVANVQIAYTDRSVAATRHVAGRSGPVRVIRSNG
jgi:hypothetical protein